MKRIIAISVFALCFCLTQARAQKYHFTPNWVKIDNSRFGFVVGSNNKDRLYFVTIMNSRATRDDSEINIILPDGKGESKARLVTEINFQKKYLALYVYEGNAAKRTVKGYYRDLSVNSSKNYLLMVDGAPPGEDFKTMPYVPKKHTATYQETISADDGLYYFNKTGGTVELGMPLLDESGKVVLGLAADNLGSKDDIFSVIDMEVIAEKIRSYNRNGCEYFNLLEVGETMTPCQKKEKEKRLEEERRIREEIERKNRTTEQKRIARRTTNWWISAGPAVAGNFSAKTASDTSAGFTGFGYSAGMNFYINPNPGSWFHLSLRPRYSSTRFNLKPKSGTSDQFHSRTLSMVTYDVPVVLETGAAGPYFGIGYVPSYVKSIKHTYQVGTGATREQYFTDRPTYVHRVHLETGWQEKNLRVTIFYQRLFGGILNPHYEVIAGSEVVRPFEDYKGYGTFGLEFSLRLLGWWRTL